MVIHESDTGEIVAQNRPLTAAFVRTVTRPGRYGDGGRGSFGLYLRVWHRPNGRVGKSWAQRLRINGRVTNLGLGPVAFVSLREAREKARENARLAYQGRDPRSGATPTFRETAEKVIELRARSWKPGSNLPGKWRQTLQDYAYPVIGDKRLVDVTRADILAIVAPIWSAKPAAAKIVLQRVGLILKYGVAQGLVEHNVADASAITAALPKNGGHVHHKALPHDEVADVLRALRGASRFQPSARLALEVSGADGRPRFRGPGRAVERDRRGHLDDSGVQDESEA